MTLKIKAVGIALVLFLAGPAWADFQVTGLTPNNASAIEHNFITGDDRGGIATSNARVFYTGDAWTGRWALADLSGAVNIGAQFDGLVSDFKRGKVYTIATAGGSTNGGLITRLRELDGTTGGLTGTDITLSAAISMPGGSSLYSGYGYVVLHNTANAYKVDLPSGTVTDLGAMGSPTRSGCENWATWGVAEDFGGDTYLLTSTFSQILRTRVPDGAQTVLATFTSLSDMCSFTVAPNLRRWYFHHEGTSQFRSGDETIGFADATFARTLDVGYYEMNAGQGAANQASVITTAGHTPVLLTDVTAASLANVQVLFANNASNGSYSAEYTGSLADVEAFVANGGVLIIHDRYVDGAEAILPNGGGFSIVRDFSDDANIDVADNSTIITNGAGPGGSIGDTSLDGGNSSTHGFTFDASIPVSGLRILSTGDPSHIVTFVYSHGFGYVIYSSIPLDFYLGGSNTVANNMKAYAANVIAYAAQLIGGVPGAVDQFNYLDYFNDDEEEEEEALQDDDNGAALPPLTLAVLLVTLLVARRRRR